MRNPAEAIWDPHDVQQPQLADRYTVIYGPVALLVSGIAAFPFTSPCA
ncbi:hypothetical protein Q3Y53_12335 [Synechococcus sp. YX-04-1]|nr:hypothetical protein [Synechococcus sp. YX-04-1]